MKPEDDIAKQLLEIDTPLTKTAGVLIQKISKELKESRQALWDIYGILGFDTDGDKTPDALKYPPLTELVVNAAKESRQDYDNLLQELKEAPR